MERVFDVEQPVPEPQPITPVAGRERIAAMDVLRGIAVFGIFLVNMPLFVAPSKAFFDWESNPLWTSTPDRAVTLLIYIFAQGKFYTLFSFLFGLGFGVQMIRAAERNAANFERVYGRRLGVLLAIGTVHFMAVWWGDVLHVYALLGFLLFVFRDCTSRTLVHWVMWLTFLPVAAGIVGTTIGHFVEKKPAVARDLQRLRNQERQATKMAENIRVYQSGTAAEILADRAKANLNHLAAEAGWSMELLGNFLLGLLAARHRVLTSVGEHLPLLRKLACAGLPLALLFTAGDLLYGYQHPGEPDPLWRTHTGLIREFLCRPLIAYGYAAALLLTGVRGWMTPIAAVGRMALTNYLLHSLTFTTIALSYGFAQYAKIPPVMGLLYCVGFYALQVPFSQWWLRHHPYGPAEWLWRSLTYGERQPWANPR